MFEGVTFHSSNRTIQAYLASVIADSPLRKQAICIKETASARRGCEKCKQAGLFSGHRYYPFIPNPPANNKRTHEDVCATAMEINNLRQADDNRAANDLSMNTGVNGLSPLDNLTYYNLINMTPSEIFHVLLDTMHKVRSDCCCNLEVIDSNPQSSTCAC